MLYYVDQRFFFCLFYFAGTFFSLLMQIVMIFQSAPPLAFYSLSVYFGRSPFSLVPSDLASLELFCK